MMKYGKIVYGRHAALKASFRTPYLPTILILHKYWLMSGKQTTLRRLIWVNSLLKRIFSQPLDCSWLVTRPYNSWIFYGLV